VLQHGSDFDLAKKPLHAESNRQLGEQYFDGNWAIVLEIARKKNRRHAAATELTLERVSAGERSLKRR
jgi:hypothetical protein